LAGASAQCTVGINSISAITLLHGFIFIEQLLQSWHLGNWQRLVASAGFTFIAPDGSTYNGMSNPDYWTYEPRVGLAYLGKDWNLTANLKYDFNTASAGHTGAYQIVAGASPIPAVAWGDEAAPSKRCTGKPRSQRTNREAPWRGIKPSGPGEAPPGSA
jgi:hypothetical protein